MIVRKSGDIWSDSSNKPFMFDEGSLHIATTKAGGYEVTAYLIYENPDTPFWSYVAPNLEDASKAAKGFQKKHKWNRKKTLEEIAEHQRKEKQEEDKNVVIGFLAFAGIAIVCCIIYTIVTMIL